MREFPNPIILGRNGEKITIPAIWNRKIDGEMLPLTPRRLILMACHTMKDGRPEDLSFNRKTNKVLDQIEPQEKKGLDTLSIDTENLEHIRPWVNIDVAKTWPVDSPDMIDAFDRIIDGNKEEKADPAGEVETPATPEPSQDGHDPEKEALASTVEAPVPADNP